MSKRVSRCSQISWLLRRLLAVAPVRGEPDDVEPGAVDGERPEHEEREAAGVERRDEVGEDAVGRLDVAAGKISVAPSKIGQQLAVVVPGAAVDRRQHALVAVVVQGDDRAPGVERLGPTVFGWIVRAWYTSRKASARIFQLQPSSTLLVSMTRNGAAATSGSSRGSGSRKSSSGIGVGVEVDEVPAAPRARSARGGRPRSSFAGRRSRARPGTRTSSPAQVVAPRVELAHEHAGCPAVAPHDRARHGGGRRCRRPRTSPSSSRASRIGAPTMSHSL